MIEIAMSAAVALILQSRIPALCQANKTDFEDGYGCYIFSYSAFPAQNEGFLPELEGYEQHRRPDGSMDFLYMKTQRVDAYTTFNTQMTPGVCAQWLNNDQENWWPCPEQ